jgi:hypothetical protein
MVTATKFVAAALGGLLLVAAYTPAWAGEATTAPIAPATTASNDHSLVGVLSPLLTDTVQHKAQKNCKADSLYSQHAVVGDPDSCFMDRYDTRVQSINPVFSGIL